MIDELAQSLAAAWTTMGWPARIATLAWVAATMGMPIVRWIWGERSLRWGVTASVLLQAAAVVIILAGAWGWARTGLLALAIVAMGWAVEYVGSRTGVPFGRYRYTERLQPQLGHVPLLIPAAWLMMMPPAWAVAQYVTGCTGPGAISVSFVAVSALAFTAWDLFLDPQMVGWRLWVWERPGGYFGIPWVNFAGWALAAAAMTTVMRVGFCPGSLPALPLVSIYVLTWLLETIGLGVLWRQPGPAACGFAGMGGLLLWAWIAAGPGWA
jgi:putative membrane protein